MTSPSPATARSCAERVDGYAPLRSYAAIGAGRTVALVADDGAIDWLALPDLDSPSVFAALLDAAHGGSFTLAPTVAHTVSRRYLPETNVLETTFVTDTGTVAVLDAMTVRGRGLGPLRELQRRVVGVSGTVSMAWRVWPRFGYGQRRTRLGWRAGVPVATAGSDAIAVRAFGAGTVEMDAEAVTGTFEAVPGSAAVIALCMAHQEPLVLPSRAELDDRFTETLRTWRVWTATRGYDGPWRAAVSRSALALKLLVYAPSGAIAAAATTSLPEELGGERNWDYRFCWVRDAAFTLDALFRLGWAPEAQAYFWWLVHASQLTHPRLQPLYRLDGGPQARERVLPLAGYRGSAPMRVGNAAADQLQLDTYGELLQTAWLYVQAGQPLEPDIGRRLAETADLVARLWAEPDAGIWEVRSAPRHFTQSKMMCWVALDRATPAGRPRPHPRPARRALAPRGHRGRANSSSPAAGRRPSAATAATPTPTSWTPPYCWGCWPTTATRTRLGGEARSTRSAASSGTAPTSTATPARTGCAGARAHSSPARSGSPRPWPAPIGSRRPQR